MQLGQTEKAQDFMRKATKIDPRDAQVPILFCYYFFLVKDSPISINARTKGRNSFSPAYVELLVLDLFTLISVIQAFLDLGELLISSDAAVALDALKTVRFHYCSLLNRKKFSSELKFCF